MRKIYLTFMLLAIVAIAHAQHIAVKDFYYAENDLTARLKGTSVEDQNGYQCALIKVETTEKGLWTFDVGMLGVTKMEMQNAAHSAEIWVYVPFGVTWITVQHEQLGKLSRYQFPCGIEKGCTYIMQLITGKVETIIKEEVRQQYLLFQLDPPNAILEVDDKLWSVEADGTAMKYVDFGTYRYRVRASDYSEEVGKVTVDNPDETEIVTVKLKSNLTDVTLKVDADAEIWVNNQKKGIRTWTGKLGNGTYKIECKQAGYETSMISKEITREMNGETITLPAPTPVYGSLMVESTPNLATIFIDGKEVGKTPKSLNEVLACQHEIKLVKDGYEDHTETLTITQGERKQVKVTMNKQEGQSLLANNINNGEEQTFTVNGVSFTMKRVEGGIFQMGATSEQGSEAENSEKPVHSVTLSSYYMGDTEVTQALWKAVMGSEPTYNGGWESKYGRGNEYPAYRVSWNDIQEFIRKLNQKTGKNFRLPTEAEWEYAARGGKKSNGYKYAGSNIIGSVARYTETSNDKSTKPVKTKSPNELGLYDMSGNVYEWCNDWYGSDYYEKSSLSNPQGPSSGSYRVLRGGSWYSNARCCRVSYRRSDDSSSRFNYYGFRLCLSQ